MIEENKRAPRSKERGAGKNNKGTTRVSFSVSCQPEELVVLKQKAKESHKTVSKFLLDLVFNN